jgi:phosphoribosylglycinamide formyltransferase-1
MPFRIGILISGRGSNMLALSEYALQPQVDAEVALVIADKPALGLDHATQLGIDTLVLNRLDYQDRASHEAALINALDLARVDAVFLAGYMRVLSGNFCRHYQGRLFNIHPSLLPRHKGLDTHQRALDAGDAEHGCSVHLVTADLDDGPVLIQHAVPVLADDDADRLAARVLTQEHMIYPMVLGALVAGLLKIDGDQITMEMGTLPGDIKGMDSPASWPA